MTTRVIFFLALLFLSAHAKAQTAEDIFTHSGVPIVWLGVDYSHVQLVGDMAQFGGAGMKGPKEIRERYMPAWNRLVVGETSRYDIAGMLRKDEVDYDIAMISALNATTPLEDMEAFQASAYSGEDVGEFIARYNVQDKTGIGVLLIAESLDKFKEEATYHFVAISLPGKNILLQERLVGKPRGFGLRNYWAGSIYDVIKQIKGRKYRVWKKQYQSK